MRLTHADALVVQLGLITEALAITLEKRADYSNQFDPYANYREGNDIAGITHPWQYAVRRNIEKFTRRKNIMANSAGKARSSDESFKDAARDSINLIHIEFGLQLEEMENGAAILRELNRSIDLLPGLVASFIAKIEAAESGVGVGGTLDVTK